MTLHLCDVNVWLALTISTHGHHDAVRRWFDSIIDAESIYFCRTTQQSYVRLLSTAAVLVPYGLAPLTNERAWATFEALIDDDRVALWPGEPEGIEALWKQYALHTSPAPKLWMDAYLAAFARAGGWQMVTTDAAFRQFGGLDVVLLGGDGSPA